MRAVSVPRVERLGQVVVGAGMMAPDREAFGREQLADKMAQLSIVVHDGDGPGCHRSRLSPKAGAGAVRNGKARVKDS